MPLNTNAAMAKDKASGAGVKLEHRHFAFIAAVIADMPDHAASLRAQKFSIAAAFAAAFAAACAKTNVNFDHDRFMVACNAIKAAC